MERTRSRKSSASSSRAGIDRAAIEQGRIGEPRDGPRRQKIAKRARGVLGVGFQLVQRAVEVGVTRINQRLQRREYRSVRVRAGETRS